MVPEQVQWARSADYNRLVLLGFRPQPPQLADFHKMGQCIRAVKNTYSIPFDAVPMKHILSAYSDSAMEYISF